MIYCCCIITSFARRSLHHCSSGLKCIGISENALQSYKKVLRVSHFYQFFL